MSPVDEGNAIVFDSLGNIIVGGSSKVGGIRRMTVIKLSKSLGWALDTSFGGGDGVAMLDFPQMLQSRGWGVTRDSANRVIVTGYAMPTSTTGVMAVARLKADGTPDPTFSQDGMTTLPFPNSDSSEGYVVSIPSNGIATSLNPILVAGFADITLQSRRVALARLTPLGVLDTTYGRDHTGRVETTFPPARSVSLLSATTTTSGKLIAVGFTQP